MIGRSAKSSRLVNWAVLLPRCSEPLASFLRCLMTTDEETSSTILSPPKARRAKLPARSPTPIEPRTSMTIQAELRYSTERPALILICLHDWWPLLQQHETQFEQSLGAAHGAQDSSAQPQL